MKFFSQSVFSFCSAIALVISPPALADSDLRITLDQDTEAFENRNMSESAIRVSVSYQPPNESDELENLHYEIYYDDTVQLEASQSTFYRGGVSLRDLDQNGMPEVIVETYTGGAHCCTSFTVYTWRDSQFEDIQLDMLDGGGGTFRDLDEDGLQEFSTYDNAFLYAFSSYAGSYPPSVILTFQDGEFRDMTHTYEQIVRSRAWSMFQTLESAESEGYEVNGILAGYVAQKILLDEYESGWELMLARYDRASDWGLEILNDQGNVIGRHPDFPTALRAFLTELDYLTEQGDANPTVSRME
ncbi:MAG: hypothetical protein ACFE0J_07750 [Elainellaceae cyanobacterium]